MNTFPSPIPSSFQERSPFPPLFQVTLHLPSNPIRSQQDLMPIDPGPKILNSFQVMQKHNCTLSLQEKQQSPDLILKQGN